MTWYHYLRFWNKILNLANAAIIINKPFRSVRDPMTFASRSPVWLSRYLWLEIEISFFVFLTVAITLQSIGENEYGKTGHSKIIIFCGTSWSFWSPIFLRLQYYTILQSLNISDLTLLKDYFKSEFIFYRFSILFWWSEVGFIRQETTECRIDAPVDSSQEMWQETWLIRAQLVFIISSKWHRL